MSRPVRIDKTSIRGVNQIHRFLTPKPAMPCTRQVEMAMPCTRRIEMQGDKRAIRNVVVLQTDTFGESEYNSESYQIVLCYPKR